MGRRQDHEERGVSRSKRKGKKVARDFTYEKAAEKKEIETHPERIETIGFFSRFFSRSRFHFLRKTFFGFVFSRVIARSRSFVASVCRGWSLSLIRRFFMLLRRCCVASLFFSSSFCSHSRLFSHVVSAVSLLVSRRCCSRVVVVVFALFSFSFSFCCFSLASSCLSFLALSFLLALRLKTKRGGKRGEEGGRNETKREKRLRDFLFQQIVRKERCVAFFRVVFEID